MENLLHRLYGVDAPAWKPTVRRKHLGDISYTRRIIGDFVLNFVAMTTGLVVVEFVWHHSIAHPRISPTRHKRHHDIFYTRTVIACFVSNFVAMATRVGRCKIWLTSFDSPTEQKPPVRRKHVWDISYTSRVIADFVPNFVVMATGVGPGKICLASFNSPIPKTPC